MTKDDYNRLADSIEKNQELLYSIKDELITEVSALKLAQQKLRFMIYGVAFLAVVITNKPEFLSAMLSIS